MFCEKCGSVLNADGTCPVCNANQTPEVVETVPAVPDKDPGKTMGIVSLILGIVSLLVGGICACFTAGCATPVFVISAIAGVVLGAMGMKKSKAAGFKGTLGMVGLILSIVGLAAMAISGLVMGIIAIIGGAAEATAANSYYYY